MKKKLVIALVCAMTAATVLSGCGKKGNSTGSSSAEEEDVQISAEDLLKATEYDVDEYVTLSDNYMSMNVELQDIYEVTDDAIKTYAEQLISMYPAYEETDKTDVEDKDVVNIDYEGKIDGEVFDGGTGEGAHLEIGSGSFIDGFEDGLIGKKVGDTVELNLKFPDDYQTTDVAGKDVVFTVTINSIEKAADMTYDTITDEYVNSNFATSGITTVDAFKEQIQSGLESQNEQQRQTDLQAKVLEQLEADCQVSYPEGLIDERVSEYKANVTQEAETAGQTLAEYLTANYNMTEEAFEEDLKTSMEENLKQELILEAIVKAEDISISTSEFTTFVSSYISYYGVASEEEFYEQFGGEDYVRLSYAENQALSKVMEGAAVTYTEASDTDSADDSTN